MEGARAGSRAGAGEGEEAFGDGLPRLLGVPPGPRSLEMADRLSLVESRNVTFRDPEFPVFWSEARGANVRDVDGNVYVDLTGAFGVAVAGHTHPRIASAIEAQSRLLVHGMGDVHPPERKLALLERLGALMPWPEPRGVLASSGSEAVEIALKTAHLATGRPGVVAFRGSYHGLTLGALSTTARNEFRAPFRARIPEDVSFAPFPDPLRDGEEAARVALRALDDVLGESEKRGAPPGAILIEPIQGRAGVRIPPAGFLAEVVRRAEKVGALSIFDEVFTGFGRTGTLFAFEADGVVPDLLCLGKALGGGLPLSACMGPARVMNAWPTSSGEALHTSTFLGHPLSCASALAFLDVLEEEELPARARHEGLWLLAWLREALEGCPWVGEVRGRGLFVGVELVDADSGLEADLASPVQGPGTEDGRKPPRPPRAPPRGLGAWEGAGARVAVQLLRKGLLVLPAGDRGEVVELSPPLTISRKQLEWAAETLAETILGLRP